MAGVHVVWNLGPIAMARGGNPLPYLNAHVSLVGLRALLGMVGGVFLQRSLGSVAVFWAVAVSQVLGPVALLVRHLSRRQRPRLAPLWRARGRRYLAGRPWLPPLPLAVLRPRWW